MVTPPTRATSFYHWDNSPAHGLWLAWIAVLWVSSWHVVSRFMSIYKTHLPKTGIPTTRSTLSGLGWVVVCGLWFFLRSWSGCGLWFVVFSQVLVGLWFVVCGLWFFSEVLAGLWFVVCGFFLNSCLSWLGGVAKTMEKNHKPQTTSQPRPQKKPQTTNHKPAKTSEKTTNHKPQTTSQPRPQKDHQTATTNH